MNSSTSSSRGGTGEPGWAMGYPRPLRPKERDLLESVLPNDRPGYRRYRERIASLLVIGDGRRGSGDLILGISGDVPDRSSPLAPVIAYGMVEATTDTFSITVREETGNQINVEIVSGRGGEVDDHFEEKRRWTYSTWLPGSPSPACGTPIREVHVDEALTLAFSPAERRIWVHDVATGIVHLIPITNFHNELMRRKGKRDPESARRPQMLWDQLHESSDAELRDAFVAYNGLKHRVEVRPPSQPTPQTGLGHWLRRWVPGGRR
ncbi:MAG: hypothetical protein AB1428_00050 [Bacteroidota bacterium]